MIEIQMLENLFKKFISRNLISVNASNKFMILSITVNKIAKEKLT